MLDSGAEVSLIHRRVYDSLKNKPKLYKPSLNLATAGNTPLHVDGFTNIEFEVGGIKMRHKFYVVKNLNRNVILGIDWLQSRGVRVYHDLGCIRVHGTYIPLVDDIHVASIIRSNAKVKLLPQTAHVCYCRVRKHPQFQVGDDYEITPLESGYLGNEPGLLLANSVVNLKSNYKIPVMLVNTTCKTLSLKQGTPIAVIRSLNSVNITTIDKQGIKSPITSENIPADDKTFDCVDVPLEHKSQVIKLLQKNRDLFAETDAGLSHTDTVTMKINTGNHPPIKLKPYRTQLNNRKIIDKAVDEMLDAKIISRSRSEWSFPVVIVDKKDGSKRFCVDFRQLNKITISNSYPLPIIDDILALLGKARYFTSIDLKSGYWQVLMHPEDKCKTAFTCHRGLFEFNVMPFGLTNAPAIFQELMNRVLEGLSQFSTCYLDDILVFSETLEDHFSHIQQVFGRLREHSLRLKLKKCSFLKSETTYLGFVINNQGVIPEKRKVDIIRNLLPPKTVREVRSFIGMCSYYRRFIPHFSEIAEPIISLTRKFARFNWTDECQVAFDKLKDKLVELPLLSFPDPSLPYQLYTDASDKCIGACLTQFVSLDGEQVERPIYYLSHRLSDTQTRWSTIEKEAYAIYYSLQKLDHYLHNAEFVIKCDHRPLKYLLESPMQNKKISLWALSIAGYNCKIEYLRGSDNSVADLLSRIPSDVINNEDSPLNDPDVSNQTYEIGALNSNRFEPRQYARCQPNFNDYVKKPTFRELDMRVEQDKDDVIVKIKLGLKQDTLSPSIVRKYLVLDEILYFISDPDKEPILRLVIPQHLQKEVLSQYHEILGHMGIDKTYDALHQKYYWVNLYKDVTKFVNECVTCQLRSTHQNKVPVQETDTPPFAWAKCAIDVSGPYPTSLSGNKYIVSFIDLFSGYPEAFATPNKEAETIAHLIIDEICTRYSCPLEILSDNGSENVNKVVKETLTALNINHVTTSFYRPQANGLIERYHRTLVDVISKKLSTNEGTWDMFLNQALAAIRFGVNESTKASPFRLLFNREVVFPIDNVLRPRRKYQGEEPHKIALEQQHKAFILVHKNREKARAKRNQYANKNAKDVLLNVNDPVYYRNHTRKNKLDPKWKPYYRILEQTSPVTFLIKNQLDGSTVKAHAQHLRLANLNEWQIPKDNTGRPIRQARFVEPPVDNSLSGESSDSEVNDRFSLTRHYRKERSDSDSEDDLPLFELQQRMRCRRERARAEEKAAVSNYEFSSEDVSADN